MREVPSLITLCIYTIRDELIQGDICIFIFCFYGTIQSYCLAFLFLFSGDDVELSSVLYQLPTELFDQLLPQLPPLALQKLQERLLAQHSNFKIICVFSKCSI